MLTLSREAIPYSVGTVEFYYAAFAPSDLPAAKSILDGRTIKSDPAPTYQIMDGQTGTVSDISVVSEPITINGETIAAGTAVRFKVSGLQPREGGLETVIKIIPTLSDDTVVPLGVRFLVEA